MAGAVETTGPPKLRIKYETIADDPLLSSSGTFIHSPRHGRDESTSTCWSRLVPVAATVLLFSAGFIGSRFTAQTPTATASHALRGGREMTFMGLPPSLRRVQGPKGGMPREVTRQRQRRGKAVMAEETSDSCVEDSTAPWVVSSCSCDTSLPVLSGADAVAYFSLTDNTSYVMGSSDYTATLNGYTFYFASKENMETFVSDPWSYAPAFGGYCSWGMTEEHEPEYDWNPSDLGPSGDLGTWYIHEGHLLLFKDDTPKSKFLVDPDTYYQDGVTRWTAWYGSQESSPFNTACYTTSSS